MRLAPVDTIVTTFCIQKGGFKMGGEMMIENGDLNLPFICIRKVISFPVFVYADKNTLRLPLPWPGFFMTRWFERD